MTMSKSEINLLPTAINSSAGNKNWIDKWIYYRHVAEIDPDKLANLKQEAEDNRIKLKMQQLIH